MFTYIELHNHTTESDGGLSVESLVEYMDNHHVGAFAITDHNTTSGHQKLLKSLKDRGSSLKAIYGIEYTTYYGHILAYNTTGYTTWENINRHDGDSFIKAIKEKAGLVGIAHPFAYGYPIATCGFAMSLKDHSLIDFIEVWNSDDDMTDTLNAQAIEWWESTVFDGQRVAATSGMDLHGPVGMKDKFGTYIRVARDIDLNDQLERAIKAQQTWVSKGALLVTSKDEEKLVLNILDMKKNGTRLEDHGSYVIQLRTVSGVKEYECKFGDSLEINFDVFEEEDIVIAKLYKHAIRLENLVCIAPPIHL